MPRVVSQRVHLWPGGPFSERALTLESSLTEELIRGAGGPWRGTVSRATGWRGSGAGDRSLNLSWATLVRRSAGGGIGRAYDKRSGGERGNPAHAQAREDPFADPVHLGAPGVRSARVASSDAVVTNLLRPLGALITLIANCGKSVLRTGAIHLVIKKY